MPAPALPELIELDRLIAEGGPHLQARELCRVTAGPDDDGDGGDDSAEYGDSRYPVIAVTLGNPDPAVPAIGFFGGVHGLERIGAEVVLAHLRTLVMRLPWDGLLHRQLEIQRLVFLPVVNPGGIARRTRANPNGVDLMRNAPVEAAEGAHPLVGGQRRSATWPWYRGAPGAPMEAESAALCALVEDELLPRPFALAVDCHSGFGMRDRLWFPYAHRREPIEHAAELHALVQMFDRAHAHHRYLFEPQSRQYLTHGDLWDHLYLQALRRGGPGVFLPLTLEMGSWLWVRKNPRQLLSRHGLFNPLIAHRQQRVLRQHTALFDFLARAAAAADRWLPRDAARQRHQAAGLARWYAPDGR